MFCGWSFYSVGIARSSRGNGRERRLRELISRRLRKDESARPDTNAPRYFATERHVCWPPSGLNDSILNSVHRREMNAREVCGSQLKVVMDHCSAFTALEFGGLTSVCPIRCRLTVMVSIAPSLPPAKCPKRVGDAIPGKNFCSYGGALLALTTSGP